jgi:hypothetical protein
VVDRRKILDGSAVQEGDLLVGLPSTGLHTNGYSLARKVLFEVLGCRPDQVLPELGVSVADELLKIHRSYLEPVWPLLDEGWVHAVAHITGGGITGNLPGSCGAGAIEVGAWRSRRCSACWRSARVPRGRHVADLQPRRRMILVVPPGGGEGPRVAEAERLASRWATSSPAAAASTTTTRRPASPAAGARGSRRIGLFGGRG